MSGGDFGGDMGGDRGGDMRGDMRGDMGGAGRAPGAGDGDGDALRSFRGTRAGDTARSEDDAPFTDEATRELLELALHRERGRFAPLLERLERPGGDIWFDVALARICTRSGVGEPEFDSTVRGLDALRRLKQHCRSELEAAKGSAPEPETLRRSSESGGDAPSATVAAEAHTEALAGYALSVGMAQALHGVMISGLPREEWESLFDRLSELVPQPWSSHFRRASGDADA